MGVASFLNSVAVLVFALCCHITYPPPKTHCIYSIYTCAHSPCLQVLPMENVAGRDIVEGGNLCERKNGRGVDPNRNWDIDWGVKEKDYDPKEEYPGKAALRCV